MPEFGCIVTVDVNQNSLGSHCDNSGNGNWEFQRTTLTNSLVILTIANEFFDSQNVEDNCDPVRKPWMTKSKSALYT